MASVYSVSVRVIWGAAGPDPNLAFGELQSGTVALDWPATLTSISLNGQPITDLSIFTTSFSGSVPSITITRALARFRSEGTTTTWPAASTGIFTASPASSAQTTAQPTTPSVTSGTTVSGTKSTETGTSSLSTPTLEPSSPPGASTSSGLATGAIAGIAIGCALVGVAIGLLAALCLFKRRGRRDGPVDNAAAPLHQPGTYPSEKGLAANDIQLSQFLLEATPDRDIVQETQSIGALIDQHVESYYHKHSISVDASALAPSLAQLGFPLSTTAAASLDACGAAALCLDPRTRQAGLRHVLMRVLLSSIDAHHPPHGGPSMLPAPVASFLRAMPSSEGDRYQDPQVNARALREWRTLAAFLLHPARSQRSSLPVEEAAVAAQARELADSLNAFLRIFVHPQQQNQLEHLQAIIEECAKLGYMLFSHPSDWEFVFAAAAKRGVVVEAGLSKLQGRDGGANPCSQRLLEPVVVSI